MKTIHNSSEKESPLSHLQQPRGTRDILHKDKSRQNKILEIAKSITLTHGFQDIETPIFEDTSLFYRLGESSDIVTKETYTFQDRGGHSLTLRPEGTAPVARALISNGLTQNLPGKFFYCGPMFRYERPQKGRYRQFTQIGVELFGRDSYHADIEVIQLADTFLKDLGLRDSVSLEINTLRDKESRDAYRAALVSYFNIHKNNLSEDSKRRLEKNPLRILDSKDIKDRDLLKEAPLFSEYLTDASKEFFNNITKALNILGIQYNHNQQLVRGLDYYCHTAFEFVTTDLGAQGTLLAGGRYDGLVKNLGGPDISGVGWAAGLDRLALLADITLPEQRPICLLPLCEKAELECYKIATTLRAQGFYVETIYTGNIGKRLKKATKLNASHALLLGENELVSGQIQIKNLDASTDVKIALADLTTYFKS